MQRFTFFSVCGIHNSPEARQHTNQAKGSETNDKRRNCATQQNVSMDDFVLENESLVMVRREDNIKACWVFATKHKRERPIYLHVHAKIML